MRYGRLLALLLAVVVCSTAPTGRAGARPLTVLAAASMTDVLEEIGAAYARAGGRKARFSFASSSALARQISAGAPADVFISANSAWMDTLDAHGLLEPGTRRDIAANRLAIVTATGGRALSRELAEPPDLDELLGPRGRLSIGDPDHVPAGIYAAQALRAWGLWEDAQPRLARADNVRAALALVTRREAPAGIVYATDAAAFSDIAVLGLIPAHLHEPIVYPAAVIAGHAGEARAFMDFLAGEKAKSILRAHGFAVR